MQSLLHRRVDAAMGRIPCDLIIRDVRYLDVFNATWQQGDVAILDGFIVAVDPGLKGKREESGRGKWLVPGFIDAHVHVESSLMVPANFEATVLPRGTTTVICDPHELTNVHGASALEYFVNWADVLGIDMRVMLSSCVPATGLETNGGGTVSAEALRPFVGHAKVLGLAEMMNVPGVLNTDSGVMEKLTDFQGRPIDGHAPLLSGKELSAYLTTGIGTCHESTSQAEALEKVAKGMAVWIREGSVAKDLKALAPMLNLANSPMLGFCSDDRNPADIFREGHIDYLIRESIAMGIPSEAVFRSASWSVARHYGLRRKGGIAPGYEADLVLLSDRDSVSVAKVWRRGILTEELIGSKKVDTVFGNSVKATVPDETSLVGPTGRVHVIGVRPGKIITDHLVEASSAEGVAKITVLERHGHGGRPSNGYVRGFGNQFRGAIASSVGHDSHNLVVVGSHPADMRVALARLIETGGGFAVVKDGKVIASLSLAVGGLMSRAEPAAINQDLEKLYDASRAVGCELDEPFLQLAFLSLPVIPHLKITDRGLVDVDRFELIAVSTASEARTKVSRPTT